MLCYFTLSSLLCRLTNNGQGWTTSNCKAENALFADKVAFLPSSQPCPLTKWNSTKRCVVKSSLLRYHFNFIPSMTWAATLDYGRKTKNEDIRPGPLRPANIIRNKFPTYKNGSNGIVIKLADGPEVPPLKEVVAKETEELLDRRQRFSVRELAMKFEKGLNTATLLSKEVKWRQVALLERDILLKNLKSVLESLRGQVTGKTKDEIEESISMVEILAVQLSKREAELIQQKTEVTELAKSLKLASEDAKRIVEEERVNANTEVESARSAVQRVQEALQEHEKMSKKTGKQDMEELKKEVRVARRIKMLHCPSKAMDLENEIKTLRKTFTEKSVDCVNLLKEVPQDQHMLQSQMMLDVTCKLKSILGVVVLQLNGIDQPKEAVHVLNVGRLRMRLSKGKTVVAKEFYSSSMQLCGVRGGGEAASQAMFWRPRSDLSFAVAFETARERNTAIMLARRFAIDCNIILAGPGDKTPW
ncbi:unnamed protein product [Triticum turgidum subsp. durum]|uniref:Stomatal closure-related actin-binding protein 1 n=1 Tax=Triticum turgidum subsp. durum TaxID=4567 RepID=A0A9R0TIJ2_TRITD|nr:unnamed protein product [Triticum turgidum subsp. durum]